jgi:LuxR family transcriptional regulator, maltose regulon positive regulatory protein
MPSQLLATKFYAPKPRRGLVARPTLTRRLLEGDHAKLVLISAPAGFGKSTLLAEWLATRSGAARTAWLSLDGGDDQPVSFWTHVIAAVQTAWPGIGSSAMTMLETQGQAIESILASLLNELDAQADELDLVLDDYHTISSPDIHEGLAFLLEHLPANVRLVIASRTDPSLPLARLRARGDLIEIRASDLRFTPDEADTYFNEVLGLGLSNAEVAALEGRTEGWIAALQLAGLSMQGREDVASFIAGFAGDDRYIVDYLVEEVLQRETEQVRSFLLQTSILARLSGPLCDAVTGQGGGQSTLETLHRRNLFLIPLDDRRRWYRYHHLFADVLLARLLDERPEQVAGLHRLAAEWHEQHGERAEAIHHALAGGDHARAADLIELAIPATRRARQESVLQQWLESLPQEQISVRPILSDAVAGSQLVRGEIEGVAEALEVAETWLTAWQEGRAGGMVVVDDQAFRELPGWTAIHRAGLARLSGDISGTMAHAQRALDVVDDDDLVGRGAAAALLGLAAWSEGDLEAGVARYEEAIASFERAGYLSDLIGCSIGLGDMLQALGRLSKAMHVRQRGLAVATVPGGATLRGGADMHVGIGEILRERDDLAGASQHLAQARELGDDNGLPQNPYRSRVLEALIQLARGDTDGALAQLDAAVRVYDTDFSPHVRPVAAMRARVLVMKGDLAGAWAWARSSGVTATDAPDYVHEFEHVSLARLMVAEGELHQDQDHIAHARRLLEHLLGAAEDGGRTGSLIDILVAQSLERDAAGDRPRALAALTRAIDLGEPEGYVRSILDGGPRIVSLLRQLAKARNASSHVRRLLAATSTTAEPAGQAGPGRGTQPLVEPLSERELDVLRLLDSDLDGPGIASELVVSLNTVRTHTKNIYAKLGVNSRRAAVSRAAELGVLRRAGGSAPTE